MMAGMGGIGGGAGGLGLSNSSKLFKDLDVSAKKANVSLTESAAKIGVVSASIAGLVKIANPASFERFTWAMQDMMGVIGRALTPVLDGLTDVFRTLGGLLETMRPAVMPVMDFIGKLLKLTAKLGEVIGGALAPVFESIGNVLNSVLVPVFKVLESVFKVIAPIIKLVAIPLQVLGKLFEVLMETMEPVIGIIEEFANAIGMLGDAMTAGVSDLTKMLGLTDGKMKSSVGAAVRGTQYSSIEDVGKRSSLAAFGQGSGDPKLDEAKKTNEKLDKIGTILKDNLNPMNLLNPIKQVKNISNLLDLL